MSFDPTKNCPVIRNFECIQTDCSFWNAVLGECDYYSANRARQDYNEDTGTITLAEFYPIDLGAVYKNITIVVSGNAYLRFTSLSNPVITLTTTFGRVGVPIMWKGINARYVYIYPLTPPIDYLVAGDG